MRSRPGTGVWGTAGEPQHRTAVRAVYALRGAESVYLPVLVGKLAHRSHDAPLPAELVAVPVWPPGRIATPMSRAPLPSPGSMKSVAIVGVPECWPKRGKLPFVPDGTVESCQRKMGALGGAAFG